MKVKTAQFQSLVTKAMTAASCNKMLPITSLLEISLHEGTLTLSATDSLNTVYVRAGDISGENFYVVVNAEIFAKLISRITSEEVEILVDKYKLMVNGNGKYIIELPVDSDGELIHLTNKAEWENPIEPIYVKRTALMLALESGKASLDSAASKNASDCYQGYYMGKKVITTDTMQMCGIDIEMFPERPILLRPETMDLIKNLDGEDVSVFIDDMNIKFETAGCTIVSLIMDSIEDYKVEAIESVLAAEFNSECKVNKAELLNALDRATLFVSEYDKNSVYLTFQREGILVRTRGENSEERLDYKFSDNFAPASYLLGVDRLKSLVKTVASDNVSIQYGGDLGIKIVDGSVTMLLSDEVDE